MPRLPQEFTALIRELDLPLDDDVVDPLDELSARTGLPNSAVNTAFAFLQERGIVVPGHRRTHVSASRDVYLDAMTEYHALRERPTA